MLFRVTSLSTHRIQPTQNHTFYSTNVQNTRNLINKAQNVYRYSIHSQGIDESLKTVINRGFGFLSMSKWLMRFDAMESFEQAELMIKHKKNNDKKIVDIINYGKKVVSEQNNPSHKKSFNKWYFYDENGKLHSFHDDKMGHGKIKAVLSMLG